MSQGGIDRDKDKDKDRDRENGSRMDSVWKEIEAYYTDNNVYKSVVVCSDDRDTWTLSRILGMNMHSVCTLCAEDMDDDRDLYMRRVKEFGGTSHRVFVLSYHAWRALRDDLEVYVLPEQNLVVLVDMPEICGAEVGKWMVDAKRRGFVSRNDCIIVTIDSDDSDALGDAR